MPIPVLSDLDFNSATKITNLPAGTANGHPVVYEQLNAAVQGLAWKDDVVAASVSNINLASPGSTIDGVTMATNDRFLAKDQSTGSQNGIYIWNGASTTATRATDMDASAEFNSAVVSVNGGSTNAGTTWRQTAVNPTVGSTSIVFTSFSASAASASETTAGVIEIATQSEVDAGSDTVRAIVPAYLAGWSGRPRRVGVDIGDGSANSYTVTHNFNTRDVEVQVRRNSGSYENILVDWGAATTNSVTIVFASPPSSNQFRAIVQY